MIDAQQNSEFNGIVYMIVNCVNGKRYIGRDEHNNPNYLGGGVYVQRAHKKYGKKNFIKITLKKCIDKEDLIQSEQYYLDLYNVGKNRNLYNKATNAKGGGKDGFMVYKYDLRGNYLGEYNSIKEAAVSHNVVLESIRIVIDKKDRSSCGYYWSFKKLDKIPNINLKTKAKKEYKPRVVYMYNKQGKFVRNFNSISAAARFVGTDDTNISAVVHGKKKSAANYFWLFDKYNTIPGYILTRLSKREQYCRKVFQYDINGMFIKNYDSIMVASRMNNMQFTRVSNACEKQILSNGYFWSYVNYDSFPDKIITEYYQAQKDIHAKQKHAVIQTDKDKNIIKQY